MLGDSLSLKLTITLIIVIIIGAFIAGLVIINQKTREEHFSDWENQGQSSPNNPQLPILTIMVVATLPRVFRPDMQVVHNSKRCEHC